ncbi:GerAB/ArcD/ProY family transporter [Paenibacillus sp. NFR01]|uniref:GerAB/ArcD/ProY family transporter n=1 Tax=Paenibacillus sp. NFR01 TaxID=1566279 RepID=UPI0008BB8B42|nr:GerAB/ArcD/ProY family transporter [Paenibacillus sp. NFR01]SET21157.1 Spore germination protein [Paenibacillus sp. NFR01]
MNKTPALSRYSLYVMQSLYFGGSAGYLYPSLIIRSTDSAFWVPIVVWALLAAGGACLYSLALGRVSLPMIPALRNHCGRILSILLALPLLLFIGGAIIVLLRGYTEMITMTMLPRTPIAFLNGILLVPVLMASAGIMPIVRAARVFFLLTLMLSTVLMLLSFSDLDFSLGRPWLRTDGHFLGDAAFYASSYLWTGYVFTALLGSYTGVALRKFWQPSFLSICCAMPYLLGVVYLPVLTFGPELSRQLILPYVSKLDSVYHYWIILENLTAVLLSNMMIYVLFVLSLKLHVMGQMLQDFFPSWRKRWIFGTLGVVMYTASVMIPSWAALIHLLHLMTGLRLYAMFGFPLLALTAFAVSARVQRRREAA